MTESITLNPDDLTVGEVEEIEELTGQSINMLGDPASPKGKLLRAIVYILKRRNDPAFSWEQAGQIKLQTVEADRPTDAAGSNS